MDTQRIEFVDLIPLEKIIPDPDPIRQELNKEHIQDLIESFNILPMGPLDPLVVKPIENGMYQIISGNHRYMALKEGGWVDAPCHVIEPLNDAEEFLMKLHANTKRKNLNDLETCEALAREQEIYEAFYPQAKRGHNKSGPNAQFGRTDNKAFTMVKAKALGVGVTTIKRNIQIGKVVKEIPELKEARATRMEAYVIAQRKPEEREVIENALKVSQNKPETLRLFTRHTPKQPEESPGDYAYRYFKDAHRLLKEGIDWETMTNTENVFDLAQSEVFLRLAEACQQEHDRIQKAAQAFREKAG
jgi:ParB/RepB/Spo0J family partition protein